MFNHEKKTYYKDGKVYFNAITHFEDAGTVKIIFGKEVDFTTINVKITLIIITIILFLIGSTLFLYFHIGNIYDNITKELDNFFKSAIHEIRTPIGVIQINLDFLENTLPDSMAVKRAQGGVRNLTSVYESLEYCIKHKNVQFKREDLNLSQFLRYRIDFFTVLAEIKDVQIKSDIEDNIFIHMSKVELQRLIDNNLSNAIKYAKEHTQITIKLYLRKNCAILSFSNYGNPIENISKIFRQYYRDDHVKGGFGLGLSIVENICRIYHISIQAISDDDNLITFIYKIPDTILVKNPS
jgi:signal transduction histidine kinase